MQRRIKSELPSAPPSSQREIDAFLNAARDVGVPAVASERGKLAFALDATFSRQPSWDLAQELQAEMFSAAIRFGRLDVQLIYYRGAGECRASRFVSEAADLGRLMRSISCEGGATQIRRVLTHLRQEGERTGLRAAVFVGDAVEESPEALYEVAGELGVLGLKLFLFQEGTKPGVETVFREMARLTGGAWCRFAPGAGAELAALLRAVAAFAVGGRAALTSSREAGAQRLLSAMGDRAP